MDAGFLSIRLLTPPLLLAQTTKIAAEALANVHVRNEARLSLINLQTMSDKPVDLS